MKLKKNTNIINQLAKEIYIKIDPENKSYLNNFLNLCEQLNEINKIDTKNIKPLFWLFEEKNSICFDDSEFKNLSIDEVCKNCSHHNDEYIFLNKVVDKNE